MKKTISIFTIVILVVVAYSCRKMSASSNNDSGKTVSLDLPSTPEKFYPNTSFSNGDSMNRIATLGKVLFYDQHLSVNNTISCGSCHKQSLGFADNSALSMGYAGLPTRRNSLGIASVSQAGSLFWDGREDNIQNLALRPITNHVEMGIDDPNTLPAKLAALPYYSQLFTNAYGDNNITATRISGSIAVFMGAITATSTRFDQYQSGNSSALTATEVEGMTLFNTKYPCGSCHNGGFVGGGGGGYFAGNSFRDIGLDNSYTDVGRGAITGQAKDNGTFRIPNLRNVGLTAPYMHDGRFKTLDEVVDHYSHSIQNSSNLDTLLKDKYGKAMVLNITNDEKAAIIAFLNTLTDFNVVTDPKFSNPFKIN